MRYDPVTRQPIGKVDHNAEANALVPEILRFPLVLAWLATYTKQLQDLEDALWDLFSLRFLSIATGDALDKWGRLVGETRNGDADDFYRVRIMVRIAVNRSRGNFGDLRKIALLAFGHDQFVIWAHRKTVAIHVFQPYTTAATRAMVLRWFTLAKVACDGFRLYRAVDAGPLRMTSSTSTYVPTDGMESTLSPGSGGRIMGET